MDGTGLVRRQVDPAELPADAEILPLPELIPSCGPVGGVYPLSPPSPCDWLMMKKIKMTENQNHLDQVVILRFGQYSEYKNRKIFIVVHILIIIFVPETRRRLHHSTLRKFYQVHINCPPSCTATPIFMALNLFMVAAFMSVRLSSACKSNRSFFC